MRNKIEKFCVRHPGFGIPGLMKYFAIANVLFWIAGIVNPRILQYMTFNPYLILHGQIWRILSFVFIPPSSGILALIAFYFYYWIGSTLEQAWGTPQFNIYFFSGILLTVLYGFLAFFLFRVNISLSSTYIYLSMFFSFAALFPDMQVLFMFILPIKMKYLAYVDAAFFILGVFTSPFPVNLLPVVAVLNFLIFCGGDLLRPLFRKKSPTTINFKKASKEIQKEQARALYRHKCAVCGRTDTEYPNLEFRYCSRCQGYHCFCEDHINSHIHFTE